MNLGIKSIIFFFSILNSSPSGSFPIPSCAGGSLGEQHDTVYENIKRKASLCLSLIKVNYP